MVVLFYDNNQFEFKSNPDFPATSGD